MSACCENHDSAHVHGCTLPRQSNGAEHPGGCLIHHDAPDQHAYNGPGDPIGGFLCSECGMPTESEPCPDHQPLAYAGGPRPERLPGSVDLTEPSCYEPIPTPAEQEGVVQYGSGRVTV